MPETLGEYLRRKAVPTAPPSAADVPGDITTGTLLERAEAAIIWMSGSRDFGPHGEAGVAFARDVRPLIDELHQANAAAEGGPDEVFKALGRGYRCVLWA